MIEIAELKIEVRKLECLTLVAPRPGVDAAEVIPAVVLIRAVTDRLLVSDESVRVLGVGR